MGNTGTPADESASTEGAIPMIAWRPAHERLTLEAANDAITTAVIRPGFVYGGTAIGYIKRAGCSSTQDIRRWRR